MGNRTQGDTAISQATGQDHSEHVDYNATALMWQHAWLPAQGAPTIDGEYNREEAPRRVWDRYSPPDYDYRSNYSGIPESVNHAQKIDGWNLTTEDFLIASIRGHNLEVSGSSSYFHNYNKLYDNRVTAPAGQGLHYYSGGAALCWSDSAQHGRMPTLENARMSGRVDPVRIKKPSFYSFQVKQSNVPALYLVGHWNYPKPDDPKYPNAYRYEIRDTSVRPWAYTGNLAYRDYKNKTVYVIGSHLAKVELYVNGNIKGSQVAKDNFIYEFPGIDITEHGYIEAIGYGENGNELCRQKIETAGEPAGLRVTPVTGPQGLIADGNDIAYYDLEVVDAKGRVYPLSSDKINFSLRGPATIMGGYNSGQSHLSEFKDGYNSEYLYAECGTNRLFIKSGMVPGNISLTAALEGFPAVVATLHSNPVPSGIVGGLSESMPQTLGPEEENIVHPNPGETAALQPLGKPGRTTGNLVDVEKINIKRNRLDSVSIKANNAEQDLVLLAVVYDAEGYYRNVGLKYISAGSLQAGISTVVEMNYTLPRGYGAGWETVVFAWTGIELHGLPIITKVNGTANFNHNDYTGAVSMKSSLAKAKGLDASIIVLGPGGDSISDIAYLSQSEISNGSLDFTFKLPRGSKPGKYTVIVGALSSGPLEVGSFTLETNGMGRVTGLFDHSNQASGLPGLGSRHEADMTSGTTGQQYQLLSMSKTVKASSVESGLTHLPENVVDGGRGSGANGTVGTRWADAGGDTSYPQWIEVDLGDICLVDQIDINWFKWLDSSYQYEIWTKAERDFTWTRSPVQNRNYEEEGYTLRIDQSKRSEVGNSGHSFNVPFEAQYIVIKITGVAAKTSSDTAISIFAIDIFGWPTV
ncbi:MAG: discoidin domain-containing protein [Holophagaceae bacterium]|nr:discoidin domain-containing protein [Holophagaceae bacterium]